MLVLDQARIGASWNGHQVLVRAPFQNVSVLKHIQHASHLLHDLQA